MLKHFSPLTDPRESGQGGQWADWTLHITHIWCVTDSNLVQKQFSRSCIFLRLKWVEMMNVLFQVNVAKWCIIYLNRLYHHIKHKLVYNAVLLWLLWIFIFFLLLDLQPEVGSKGTKVRLFCNRLGFLLLIACMHWNSNLFLWEMQQHPVDMLDI